MNLKELNLNDLLKGKNIAPENVLVLRHCFSKEPEFSKIVPWLAAEKPKLFNAIQRHQSSKMVEKALSRAKYVVALIGLESGKAVFVGLYAVKGKKQISHKQFWKIRENAELKKYGARGWDEEGVRPLRLWFDLILLKNCYCDWKGKLIINWPPPERAWFRWAGRNQFPIHAISEDSAFDDATKEWFEIELTWAELAVLPTRLKSRLREWRAIYYIFDKLARKGYVGSAYGKDNLLDRWKDYGKFGHGGNRLLLKRDARNFRFTILERVSPDMEAREVIQHEESWKRRLHTHHPLGLNC